MEKEFKYVRKPFANLPITSPWRYRVPILRPTQKKKKIENVPLTNNQIPNINKKQSVSNVASENSEINLRKQNFSRLMQLFPNIHPALIHKLLLECNDDFVCAVDKLLRSRCNFYQKPIIRPNINMFGSRNIPFIKNYYPLQPRFEITKQKYFIHSNNITNPIPQLCRNRSNYQFNIPFINTNKYTKNFTYILPKFVSDPKYIIKSEIIPKVQEIIPAKG